MMRKHILFEENDDGPEWVVEYHLGQSDFDDSLEDSETTEIVLNAEDFNMAVKYAQQYLRKMKSEEETSDLWKDAEILSIQLR